jgi:hypothetical protein
LLVPFFVVVAAFGIGWGGRNTYRAARNLSPHTITCAEFLAHPPDFDWVRLEGCAAVSSNIGIETFQRDDAPKGLSGDVDAVYIPLGIDGEHTGDDRAKLLLRVDHGPMLRLGSRFASDRDADAAAEALAQPLEGLVERSLDRSERDREKLRGLGLYLADEFIVIDYGARPRPLWLALGSLGIGLGALALLVRKWRRRRRPVALAKAKLVAG